MLPNSTRRASRTCLSRRRWKYRGPKNHILRVGDRLVYRSLNPKSQNEILGLDRIRQKKGIAMRGSVSVIAAVLLLQCSAIPAGAKQPTPPTAQVGTTLPPGFPVIENNYLGVPVIGFGAQGPVRRVPVIFLHGNNDTPFATACNPFRQRSQFRSVLCAKRISGERALGAWISGRSV